MSNRSQYIIPLLALGLYCQCNNVNMANNTSMIIILLALLMRDRNNNDSSDDATYIQRNADYTRTVEYTNRQTGNNGTYRNVYTTTTTTPMYASTQPYTFAYQNGNCQNCQNYQTYYPTYNTGNCGCNTVVF